MPLTEVIPRVRELSARDELRLIQTLTDDLAREVGLDLAPEAEYPVWSPHDSYEAAAQIQSFLDSRAAT